MFPFDPDTYIDDTPDEPDIYIDDVPQDFEL